MRFKRLWKIELMDNAATLIIKNVKEAWVSCTRTLPVILPSSRFPSGDIFSAFEKDSRLLTLEFDSSLCICFNPFIASAMSYHLPTFLIPQRIYFSCDARLNHLFSNRSMACRELYAVKVTAPEVLPPYFLVHQSLWINCFRHIFIASLEAEEGFDEEEMQEHYRSDIMMQPEIRDMLYFKFFCNMSQHPATGDKFHIPPFLLWGIDGGPLLTRAEGPVLRQRALLIYHGVRLFISFLRSHGLLATCSCNLRCGHQSLEYFAPPSPES